MIPTPAEFVLFEDVCSALERAYNKKVKRDRHRVLADFFQELKSRIRETEGEKDTTLYPVMRLLVPKLERERPAYNLKERRLGEVLVKVLPLRKGSQEAKSLLGDSTSSRDRDFGRKVYFVAKKILNEKTGNLTVKDINDILDKIATAEVGNKGPALDEAFSCVRRNLNAVQMQWFIRIVLKDLKLGMSDNSVLNCFHPDAQEEHNNCRNIAEVCKHLDDANNCPVEKGVKVMSPVSPMLSERLNVTEVSFLPSDKTFQLEQKFDGERFQIHMKDGEFAYFSRNGHPFVKTFGKTYEEGALTPFLKGCFKNDVRNFVIDGEMMGWHKEDKCFGCKGMPYDIKEIKEKSPYRACFCAYDLLYYNDKSLVGTAEKGGMPLTKRLAILDEMFTDVPGVIQHSTRKIVQNGSEILEELNTAMLNQEEGIVLKDVESYYIAGARTAGWYKLKPEYTDGAMPELDLVIVGIDLATNKRQGLAKSFYVACLDNTGTEKRWVCVGCVASGLKYDARNKLVALLEKRWKRTADFPPDPNIVFNKAKPDFWIPPENSFVLEIRASELRKTYRYGAEYTMRFARIMHLRDDKPVCDAMTLDEYLRPTINKGEIVRLASKRINEDQIVDSESKASKKRAVKVVEVAEPYRTDTGEDVVPTSQALAGRKICILSDDEDCPRSELIKLVAMHGGKTVIQNEADTWCCVVGRATASARGVVLSRRADVLGTAWLRALPPAATPAPLPPRHLLAARPATALALAADHDAFGDSYTEPLDMQTLALCFDKIARDVPDIYLTPQEMLELDKELFDDINPYSFLRPCFIHLVNCSSINESLSKIFGANICDVSYCHLTHIVVGKTTNTEEVNELREQIKDVFIVSEDWLEECVAQETLVGEGPYLL